MDGGAQKLRIPYDFTMIVHPARNLNAGRPFSQRPPQGFSLVECMLSVAITVTSLLAVIGLLMGSLGAARVSKQETTSGMLVRQLAGEIRDVAPPTTPDGVQQPLILLVDETLKILEHSSVNGSKLKETYMTGSPKTSAAFFARIDRVADAENPVMDRIVIRVESPASAPAANREVHKYAVLSPK